MTAFPSIIYDLGELKPKLPSLQRPVIDRAIAELMRQYRELDIANAALRREQMPRHVYTSEDGL